MREPHFGFTRHGLAVHLRAADHHPDATIYQRLNKRVAVTLTGAVGTMTTFWLFCVLSLLSLPAVLSAFSPFTGTFPSWMIKASIIALVAWVAQTFIQLVLLPAIMVGQNIQGAASDARAAKTFEDSELIADRLDTSTQGGVTEVLDAIKAHTEAVTRLLGSHQEALKAHVSGAMDAHQEKLVSSLVNVIPPPPDRGKK